MPTVLLDKGFRFFFFSNEGTEPPHVHVEHGDGYAKFWLDPISVAYNNGCAGHEVNKVEKLVEIHQEQFLEAWHEYFNR